MTPAKTKSELPIKHRFKSNEDAWIYVFRYFYQYLPILVQSYLAQKQRPCVIFDIDHTVLHYRSPLGFFVNGTELRLTSQYALGLYKLFQNALVPIYFVTARPFSEANKAGTERELQTLGLTGYERIYFMHSILSDVGTFKETVRDELRQKHVILFNVGDQWTDIVNKKVDVEHVACLLYHAEPRCDWSLKLMSKDDPHPFQNSTSSSRGSILDSVFETIAPITSSEICQKCGHLQKFHA